MSNEIKFMVEYTDTFCGEPNYGWLRKASFMALPDASNSLLVRRAKKVLNMSGWPTRTETMGETLALYPRDGSCVVVFINAEEV